MSPRQPFLDLPAEIRNQIYCHYVTEEDGYVYNFESGRLAAGKTIENRRPIDLALVFTCKQIARELQGLAFSMNTIHFTTAYSDELRVKAARFHATINFHWISSCEQIAFISEPPPLSVNFTQAMVDEVAKQYPERKSMFEDILALVGEVEPRHMNYGDFDGCCIHSVTRSDSDTAPADWVLAFNTPVWCFNPSEDDLDLDNGDTPVRRLTASYWERPHVDKNGRICRTQGKYRFSAASVAIKFLTDMPKHLRENLRKLHIHEDAVSVAYPESHAKGLISFCLENPRLRIERRVDVWRTAFQTPGSTEAVHWTPERIYLDCKDKKYTKEGGMLRQHGTHSLSAWIMEAVALVPAGMPSGSFKLILDGEISDFFQNVLQCDVARQVAWARILEERESDFELGERLSGLGYIFEGIWEALQGIVYKTCTLIECAFDPGCDLWDSEKEYSRMRDWYFLKRAVDYHVNSRRNFEPPGPATWLDLTAENVLPEFFANQKIVRIDDVDEWVTDSDEENGLGSEDDDSDSNSDRDGDGDGDD